MIVLGRFTAPYGVKGWLKLHPFGDDPDSWRNMASWWVGQDDTRFDAWQAFALESLRTQGKNWVAKLAGVDDRNAAERMVGYFVGAPREALPPPGKDTFYWADLIGLTVVNAQQETLGRVTEMLESGAHAVMTVVQDGAVQPSAQQQAMPTGQKTRLLPFVSQVISEVDVPAGVIRVIWEQDW